MWKASDSVLANLVSASGILALACVPSGPAPDGGPGLQDPHSFSRPEQAVVRHLVLDLTVDFAARTLSGRASLGIENKAGTDKLHLDTRDLDIRRVSLDNGGETTFELGTQKPFLGRPLIIDIGPRTRTVHVDYATRPAAAALQWLEPEQTADGRHPFLFTQSQAILGRTWIPCQDSPAVRMTYDATLRVPPPLLALMSAENPTEKSPQGIYTFHMPQPVPCYLMAMAVGDLEFRSLGSRTGVYAEPSRIDDAAWEFADTEKMMEATDRLYGPYRWGRYDLLVLPPSFPFGGMENPRLTFATPTILAGDRSLVALVAHELAHSWSGNLVTNATWNDFWLNEGFTVYLERRVMEELYGTDYADMLTVLGYQDLLAAVERLGPDNPLTRLHLDLAGRDPDEGFTDVPYEKGYFFLRLLEQSVGREPWDTFLRQYFDSFAFETMDTQGFVDYLDRQLLADRPALRQSLGIDAWAFGPRVPDNCPQVHSGALERVEKQVAAWVAGTPAAELATTEWTTHEWVHFLRSLPAELDRRQMTDLDAAFDLSSSTNAEILHAWLLRVIANDYDPGYPALESFLTGMGRRKFLRPLYRELAQTPEGLERARRIYAEARPTYHSLATDPIDEILGWEG